MVICNGGIGHMGHISLALTSRSLLVVVVIEGGRRSSWSGGQRSERQSWGRVRIRFFLDVLQRHPLVFDDLSKRIFNDRILDCSYPLIPLLITLCRKSGKEDRLVLATTTPKKMLERTETLSHLKCLWFPCTTAPRESVLALLIVSLLPIALKISNTQSFVILKICCTFTLSSGMIPRGLFSFLFQKRTLNALVSS